VKTEPELIPDPAAEPSLLLAKFPDGVGVVSVLSSRKPSRELFLEYGRDGNGFFDCVVAALGAGLGVKRGVPI
jgi:hypothetical protein